MLENITIDWKWAGIGAVIAIILGLLLTPLLVLVAGIIVGYMVGDGYKNGAAHGLVSGFIGGLVAGVILILGFGILGSATVGLGVGLTVGALRAMVYVVFFTGLGIVGGVIGALIKNYV
jgi:hypothetical protein